MYGFHKINKSPRGSRTLAENQVWEFSHPKFLRDRPDLLDDIKRKSLESETFRRETGDIQAQVQALQLQQGEMMQQIAALHQNLTMVMRELAESQRKQTIQQQMMKNMMDFMKQQHQKQGIIGRE
jgi:heat shock transcription factor 4